MLFHLSFKNRDMFNIGQTVPKNGKIDETSDVVLRSKVLQLVYLIRRLFVRMGTV